MSKKVPIEENQEELKVEEAIPVQEEGKELSEQDRLTARVQELEDSLAQEKDKYLRLAAETENRCKRMTEESQKRSEWAKYGFIEDLLGVVDNLERALSVVTPEQEKEPLCAGIRMTLEQLKGLLTDHGVEKFESLGKMFDAARHEAVNTRFDKKQEEGIVLEVYRDGYMRGEQLFRVATVAVNRAEESDTADKDSE